MNVLVTGGTGYIGSHTIVDLIDHGHIPICVDDQSNSDLDVIRRIKKITQKEILHYSLNLCDLDSTKKIFQEHQIDAIIHFAAFKSVGESVDKPLEYYRNNLQSQMNLLACCQEIGVSSFVYSSSCSVYGNAKELPVTETTPFGEAQSPYARTKQVGEYMIQDFGVPNPWFKSAILRYFNPAGAHPSGLMGESSKLPPTNLVPVVTEVAIGKRDSITVFGDDYDTRDGSCIRDYIHIMDLARAHTLALEALVNRQIAQCEVFNLGIGDGVTVLEVIQAFEEASGIALNYEIGHRRQGDVKAIYATVDKAKKLLRWTPKYGIADIMKSAWIWEQQRAKK